MRSFEEDIRKVMAMKEGEECTVFWSAESGGLVERVNGGYNLFEVTQYGVNIFFEKFFEEGKEVEMVRLAYTWT